MHALIEVSPEQARELRELARGDELLEKRIAQAIEFRREVLVEFEKLTETR